MTMLLAALLASAPAPPAEAAAPRPYEGELVIDAEGLPDWRFEWISRFEARIRPDRAVVLLSPDGRIQSVVEFYMFRDRRHRDGTFSALQGNDPQTVAGEEVIVPPPRLGLSYRFIRRPRGLSTIYVEGARVRKGRQAACRIILQQPRPHWLLSMPISIRRCRAWVVTKGGTDLR